MNDAVRNVEQKGMGMLKEFREFAMKGNVVDLAVGVIIGAAFGAIVTSLVGDIIMPIIGAITINVAGIALSLATSVLLGVVNTLLFGKPAAVTTPKPSLSTTIKGSTEARRKIYGEMLTGGVLVYAETGPGQSGNTNQSLHVVVALAGHECEAISDVYLDDKLSTDPQFVSSGGNNAAIASVARSSSRVSSEDMR